MDILADKIRPKKLEDIIGQEHLIGKDKILTNLVANKKLFSMIWKTRNWENFNCKCFGTRIKS